MGEKYSVKFVNYNNQSSCEQTVAYGGTAVAPAQNPVREYDDNYHYTFSEWNTSYINLTENTIVKDVYSSFQHSYNQFVETVTAPTCTSNGSNIYACSCGATNRVITLASGHSYITYVYNNATCTSDGTETATCQNCGEVFTDEIVEVCPDCGRVRYKHIPT